MAAATAPALEWLPGPRSLRKLQRYLQAIGGALEFRPYSTPQAD
ncbi:MAG TPA: hypothetical protein VHT00_15990 [Stellaceae bacterium]|jgi:hypothetical protein|nr:hypothetical protein [Stellaceae bacterium]